MNAPAHISRRTSLAGLAAFAAMPSLAAKRAKDEAGAVSAVTSGHVFTLEDGLNVRLAGIVAPGRYDAFGAEARGALWELLNGQSVRLSYGGDPRDRYGRALAQVHLQGETPLWVQAEMVRQGLARVYTWPDEEIAHRALYALEAEARARGRGLWADERYAVRGPEPNALAQHVDSLQIVEGIVTSTADIRGRAYLNFGADYRTDFTVAVAKKHRKRFGEADPVDLRGARIRVRGWVELTNGPMIWASHPARIEVLS